VVVLGRFGDCGGHPRCSVCECSGRLQESYQVTYKGHNRTAGFQQLLFAEQYNAFVKFSQDQLQQQLRDRPASCK